MRQCAAADVAAVRADAGKARDAASGRVRLKRRLRLPRRRRDQQQRHPGREGETMIVTRQPLARREFLKGVGKGAGVAIALPLLEAMIPTSLIGSAEAAQRARTFGPHNRLLILYYPNGIHTPNWYPTIPGVKTLVENSRPSPLTPEEVAAQEAKPIVARERGAMYATSQYEMAPGMKPLERHRNDFLLLGGLDVPLAKLDQAGDHAKALSCYLTGIRIRRTATDDIHSGISA